MAPLIPKLVSVALATVVWGQGTQLLTDAAIFQKLPVSDVLFTEDVLWETPARSPVDCGRLCARDAHCRVFTFQPGAGAGARSPPGRCRSHDKTRAAAKQGTSARGALSYSFLNGLS
ncbi:hypothetical protein ACOMHN_030960 [Nucella lapillus]